MANNRAMLWKATTLATCLVGIDPTKYSLNY